MRRRVAKGAPTAVEFVQTRSRAILTIRESDLNPDVEYFGALVRFVPETSSAERVAGEIVPLLLRQGAVAVRVAPRQQGEQPVVTTETTAPEPQIGVREAVEAVASRVRNVDATELRAVLSSALTEAGL